jgi:glycosyltransferase domain-containing protein
MQLQSVEHAAKSLSERFTLVVITHNRNAFVRRTLEFYRSFTGKVLVLDSSQQGDFSLADDFPAIEYHHVPQFSYSGLQDKLAYGSSVVTTPFMAFAADDDFMVHEAMAQSVEFLESNPDYGMCHGYGMMYVTRAKEVLYFRREMKVQEDYGSESAETRVMDFMNQFLPPFYAVTRTELLRSWHQSMPPGVSFEWQEIGHTFYLLTCAKARILPIPYIVREINYGGSDHSTNVLTVLTFQDAKSVADRERFAEFLAGLPTGLSASGAEHGKQVALDSFAAMADCLLNGRSLKMARIFRSEWHQPEMKPVRLFDLYQFVEMPFYNQPFFDLLTEIEFLMHAMPAGRQQLLELEGVLLRQEELLRQYPDDTEDTVRGRLWQALECSVFNPNIVERLIQALLTSGTPDEVKDLEKLRSWSQRLSRVGGQDRQKLFEGMYSGRLLKWLDERVPDARQVSKAGQVLQQDGPRFEILLLNLDNSLARLQTTFDSLVASGLKTFKVVVFMTDDLPAATTRNDTVHFVKVSASRYVERINEVANSSQADWLLLARAGDEFTASGLLRAALELRGAAGCRAVAMDEIHRQEDGSLRDIFRPGFNLDLLLSVPALMSRHWLIQKDVLVEVGGFSSEFEQALEFDLLLRIIEQGGMAGLAHLAEPLMICDAASLEENEQHSRALTRHLGARGYSAQVTSGQPGTYQVEYRHAERPLVSIILRSQDNFEAVQASLVTVLQRTRYHRHEIVIVDNHSSDQKLHEWLNDLEAKGSRIQVTRLPEMLNQSAAYNHAARQAKGEYLVFLEPDSHVINANWIESLLNQAQRPEVGIVGAKLVNAKGICTQAGLILGFDGGVGAAMAGEGKAAHGYMQRLVVEQNCTAVSSVCLMVRKALFEAVGGFDEDAFAEQFADVDLCLKVAEAGYLTVWTPQAQILHTGEVPTAAAGLQALRNKWPVPMQQDPAYNPNHLQTGKTFVLGDVQKVDWEQLVV